MLESLSSLSLQPTNKAIARHKDVVLNSMFKVVIFYQLMN
ncbi:hypothetical protein J769_2307 [Acinetobacter baumannii 25307_6]|uniref:Uncharacterized protein n=1 Tax=Acinetobacter baumannii 625974 TaxID=1310607 RepID=A0A009QD94_ACIBA|nr:hypothetical protein J543_2981 [Acinetobacter baumannii 1159076]EXA96785.1 hypothetical protein J519_3335 [Acinetobacter baumannii 1294217]EXB16762.1 hypothetical protein J516_3107 [Acinetobacter baumannii 1406750]EXC04812.1 hypothetical protein J506_3629 [Acinetobacter baumannii 625974]EXD02179.1 hypothetical protein J496_3043 [Acinetobacter baumannii 1247182]EXD10284.1 hypothetical protein J499_2213 [Acinetobacter baumannii 1289546]EXD40932.1 hypothetical protein J476_3286 [Acinetobacter